jgi:hypothetical protein
MNAIEWGDDGYIEIYPDDETAARVEAGEAFRVIRDEWSELYTTRTIHELEFTADVSDPPPTAP